MINRLGSPESALQWFGDIILQTYRESRDKNEKPSVILNAISRAIDSWNRLYSGHIESSRIAELGRMLDELSRDLGKKRSEIKRIK